LSPSGLTIAGEDAAVNARIILTFPETSRKIFSARRFTPTAAHYAQRRAIFVRRRTALRVEMILHVTDKLFHTAARYFYPSACYFTGRRNISRDGAVELRLGAIFHATKPP